MEKPLKLKTDKPLPANGMTLVEMLLVFMIVIIVAGMIPKPSFHSRTAFSLKMKEMKEHMLQAQTTAILEHSKQEVRFTTEGMYYGTQFCGYEQKLVCEPSVFHFTKDGTISKAGTIRCSDEMHQGAFVMQLGSGRIRIEER